MSDSAAADRSPLGLFPGQTAPRFNDRVVATLRSRHYSRRTEEAYLHWIRRFLALHTGIHPRELAKSDVNRFLTPRHQSRCGRVDAEPGAGSDPLEMPELVVNTMIAGPAPGSTSSKADQDRFYLGRPNYEFSGTIASLIVARVERQ